LLWIARLLVLREPQLSDESVVRSIELRRGLNILWAPPASAGEENRLFDGTITGHTAGKTTFCRLIRYLLGEQRFGAQQTQERIREKLLQGWVIGEVFVNGERWVVGRPFALGVHPFAAREISIEQAIAARGRGGYQDFLAAVTSAVVDPIPVRTLPHARQPVQWDHVLAWLTRDQEARFAGLVEWRDPASESESPKLTNDDRHVILRAMLGLMFEEEGEAQRKQEELVREKQKLEELSPRLQHRAAEDRRRLSKLLGVKDDGHEEGPLFAVRLHEHVAARSAAVERARSSLSGKEAGIEQAWQAWREAAQARGVHLQRMREAEARLDRQHGPAQTSFERSGEAGRAAEARASLPSPGLCHVPIHLAIARGCPLAVPRAELFAMESSSHERQSSGADEPAPKQEREGCEATREGRAAEEELLEARRALERAEAEERALHERCLRLTAELQEGRERLAQERAATEEVERLKRYAESAERELQQSVRRLERVTAEVREFSELSAALRREQAEALGRLTERFREVIQALLGAHVEGSAAIRGRRLELVVKDRGEREGAAMTTIKLLAFDLAALRLGIDGYGKLPCFLVHDGPREADMDGRIYERLFMVAKDLEDRFSIRPGFQYIVTTTAPPPPPLQNAPWRIEPLLDASVPEGRLLKMDL
jgi:hypothetical protein